MSKVLSAHDTKMAHPKSCMDGFLCDVSGAVRPETKLGYLEETSTNLSPSLYERILDCGENSLTEFSIARRAVSLPSGNDELCNISNTLIACSKSFPYENLLFKMHSIRNSMSPSPAKNLTTSAHSSSSNIFSINVFLELVDKPCTYLAALYSEKDL